MVKQETEETPEKETPEQKAISEQLQKMAENAEPSRESQKERNARMANGNISEEEIRKYLENPNDILFEHSLKNEKSGETIEIKVRYLTRELAQSTLESLKDSWDDVSFENLKSTLEKHFSQKESGIPGFINAEYYVATDAKDNPLGMTGVYSTDIQGGAGFATRDSLDKEKHNMNMGMGWYSVSKKAQGTGLGKYFLQWTEDMAKSRGADHFEIDTDDWSVSKKAVSMYKKSGFKEGLPIKDYFGPGRDLNVYYLDASEEPGQKNESAQNTTEITAQNKDQVLTMAQEIYGPERFEEFRLCLDILLAQNPNVDVILKGHSLAINGADGKPESFAIYAEGIYNNDLPVFWTGAKKGDKKANDNLLQAIKQIARDKDRNVITISAENEDDNLAQQGFKKAGHGIPGVFGEGDPTKLLTFTKSFYKEK